MFIDMVRSGSIINGWSYQEARCYAELNDLTLSDVEKVSRILIPELSAARSKISNTEAEKIRNRSNRNG